MVREEVYIRTCSVLVRGQETCQGRHFLNELDV